MPEGPEIHRSADKLARALEGRTAEEVFFGLEPLKRHEVDLRGRDVLGVRARGKAILTRFSGGRVIYSHNQLYGHWWVVKAGNQPKTRRQLRLAIHTEKHWALLYSASDIEVWDEQDLHLQPYLARLGPDLLGAELGVEEAVERARSKTFRRRQLAGLLLDQGFFAGMGNYLRSEVLFDAGIHPRKRPADLSEEELARLAESLLRLPRRSYETHGLTNDPERVARLKEQGVSRRHYRFAVYGRKGKPCYGCGTIIERQELASRGLFFCPSCQPR
ncbi:MAG: endonuclease VIII [Acidobacteriota bacterium]|nr:endonuclease VIII [Acidobacteriota bacterium]